MFLIRDVAQLFLYIAAWLMPLSLVLGVAGLIWRRRRRRAGQSAALLGGLLLLLVGAAYAAGNVSWRLIPALVSGYDYEPAVAPPDPQLVPRRPELIMERQLAALIGQTGPPPLHPDSPLADFTINAVHIDWGNRQWLTAVIDATLTFANDEQTKVALRLPAKGGSYLLIPFLGEVNRSAYAWYPPESDLGPLLQTPAPATALRGDTPPLTLRPIRSLDVAALDMQNVNPETSFVSTSDISAAGALLLDIDLRRDQTHAGNAVLQHTGDETDTVAETWLSARAIFAPDGNRIAYIRSRRNRPLQLVVREELGAAQTIAAVDWMTHHWVRDKRDNQIAYSHGGAAYLHNLESGEARVLVSLPPHEFMGGQQFRVSPDGRRIAYVDFDGRLWVKEIAGGRRQAIGWDVTDVSWGAGMSWRDDGQQLLFTTLNNTTLPGQTEVWLWDAAGGATRLIARAGPGFLGSDADTTVQLWHTCWVKDAVCLDDTPLAVKPPSGALRVVYESGGAIWQWRVESEEASLLFDLETLPNDAISHQVSVDGRFLAYLRRPDDATYELWVRPTGGEAYQIDTLDTTALQEEHPYANGVDLIFRWVRDSHLLLYRLDPRVQGVPAFYEAVYLAHGETGESRRLFSAGEISSLTFSPTMDQIAVTAADEVRLLDHRTGQMQHAIPLPLRRGAYSWLRYSPDGQTVAALTVPGISLIDADDGSHQDVPLDYELVGVSHYSLVPPRFWSPDGRYLYTSIAAGDDFSDISDPDGRFTVWRVDAGDAQATALKEFTGSGRAQLYTSGMDSGG